VSDASEAGAARAAALQDLSSEVQRLRGVIAGEREERLRLAEAAGRAQDLEARACKAECEAAGLRAELAACEVRAAEAERCSRMLEARTRELAAAVAAADRGLAEARAEAAAAREQLGGIRAELALGWPESGGHGACSEDSAGGDCSSSAGDAVAAGHCCVPALRPAAELAAAQEQVRMLQVGSTC
jgi:hypothetical protein